MEYTPSNELLQDSPPRVLIVTSVPPAPVVSGRSLVLAHLVKSVRCIAGPGRFRIALLGHDKLPPGLDSNEVVAVPASTATAAGISMIRGLLGRQPLSIQETRLLGGDTLKRLALLADETGATVIIGDSFRLSGLLALKRADRRVVFCVDDLLSRRYRRLADWLKENTAPVPNAFGFHSHLVPPILRKLFASRRFQLTFFHRESALLGRAEQAVARHSDAILMLNPAEADELALEVPGAPVHTGLLPLQLETKRVWDGAKLLVFLGHLEEPHNLLSLDAFIDQAMPALLAREPKLRLRLVGKGSEAVAARYHPRFGQAIEATGFVDDLSSALAPAAAMVAPIIWGTGIKIKLLDALRHGLPILCTGLAAEGLPLKDSGAAIIEDDLRLWPDLLAQLFEPGENQRMSNASYGLAARLASEAQRDIAALLYGSRR